MTRTWDDLSELARTVAILRHRLDGGDRRSAPELGQEPAHVFDVMRQPPKSPLAEPESAGPVVIEDGEEPLIYV